MSAFMMRVGIGLVGGVAGLAAMSGAKRLVQPLVKKRAPKPTDVFASERTMSPLGSHHRKDESATDALGRMAFERIVGHEPSDRQERALSWAVHIAYGLLVAGIYGGVGARERRTLARAIRTGALFGLGLWLFGDELAVPLLGLSDKPTQYDVTAHAQSLVAHLGFGIATATTTNAIRSLS
jgi:hypothetical protein